jgi:hypothetical protein
MGSRGRLRVVVAVVAATFGLWVANPAFAATIPDVTGLTASVDSAAVVTVQWDAYSFGSGTSPHLDAAVIGGGVANDTCVAGLDPSATTCQFTALDSATYDVAVTPKTDTDSGLGTDVTITVALSAPSGSVSGLQAAVDPTTNVVTVSWDPSPVNWGTGGGAVLDVGVSGLPSASNCGGLMPTGATGCHFTATATTTYTITVTPHNNVGDGTTATVNLDVVLGASPPNGAVDNLAAAFDPATGLVTVTWTSAAVAWGTGGGRGFAATITGGQVSGDGSNTCTGLLPAATPCAFRPTETATYTVAVTPTNDAGAGTRASTDVAVTVGAQGGGTGGGASGGGTGGGVTGVGTTTTGGAVSAATTASGSGGGASLAATGRSILPAVLLGLALLLTGAALVVGARLRRIRRTAAAR